MLIWRLKKITPLWQVPFFQRMVHLFSYDKWTIKRARPGNKNLILEINFSSSYNMWNYRCKLVNKYMVFGANTVKPVFSRHPKIDKTQILMRNGSLMKIESITKCSPWSILQYFWPALSNLVLKNIFGLFESGRFRQVLLYWNISLN